MKRLARISDISFADAAPKSSIQLLIRGEVAALPLEGVIDLDAERARLAKEIQKIDVDVAKIDAKLGNADFIKRAPEEVVEEQRERRDEALAARRRWKRRLGASGTPVEAYSTKRVEGRSRPFFSFWQASSSLTARHGDPKIFPAGRDGLEVVFVSNGYHAGLALPRKQVANLGSAKGLAGPDLDRFTLPAL